MDRKFICWFIVRGYLPLNKGGVVVQLSDPLQDLLRDLAVRKQVIN